MKSSKEKIQISDSIGSVSMKLTEGSQVDTIMVLAHGAGAGMDHIFMEHLAKSLAELGITTLRFNFPFIENKKGRPDVPPIAEKTISVVAAHARTIFPGIPLVVAGKSFGGRMSSQWMSQNPDPLVKALVFYGFPLHAPGKPSVIRAEHLRHVKVPMLFLQGTRDALAELALIQEVCTGLSLATLETFEGADHSFKAGKRQVIPELASATVNWLKHL